MSLHEDVNFKKVRKETTMLNKNVSQISDSLFSLSVSIAFFSVFEF